MTIVQLAEAHLLNVQREVANLNQNKVNLENEIQNLIKYAEEGNNVVKAYKELNPEQS
jgi:hypothetical protein